MRHLEVEEDWLQALNSQRVALFFSVNWSSYSLAGQQLMQEAERCWLQEYPNIPILWCTVDVSEVGPMGNIILGWLQSQDPQLLRLLVFGSGDLAWIKDQKYIASATNISRLGINGLVKRTLDAFQ